jgi:hypothetical protein
MNGAQRLALDTFSNALGTIIAVAVIYVVGVIAGVFTARAFLLTLIAVSFVANVFVLGMFARTGWASWAIPRRWKRRNDDDD